MSLLYQLTAWDIGEDPTTAASRLEAQVLREKKRQDLCAQLGVPVSDRAKDWLRKAEDNLASLRLVVGRKEKAD